MSCVARLAALVLAILAAPGVARAADLHLVQQFEIRQDATPLLTEQRDIYVQGTNLALRNAQRWLLIRPDLQQAWLLTADRQLVSHIPLDELRTTGADAMTHASPLGPLPPLAPTNEVKSLHGLSCRVHRAATSILSVEACVTRDLAALEQFQFLLGGGPEIPGVPLSFRIVVQAPNQPPYAIRQSLLRVETTRLDSALFAPPAKAPAPTAPEAP